MGVDLGIDFGTTRTVVAVCDRGNYPVVGFEAPEGASLDWYPSVVAARGERLTFGLDALPLQSDPGAVVLRSFKRVLSDPHIRPDDVVKVGEAEVAVLELVTQFLRALARDIVRRSNLPSPPKNAEPMRCVVATPANAHSTQRFITLEAFRRAGFDVIAMLNEPSAAGLEYAHRYRNTITSRREHIVVYDLGGGTFDASLVRMSGRSHDVVASSGHARLGGDDFDEKLLELVLEARRMTAADLGERARGQLLDQCRDAKERLNPNTRKVTLDLGQALGGSEDAVAVGVDVYYERCAPLVAETLATMRRVLARDTAGVVKNHEPAETGAEAVDASEVAGIYVVGGASSLPVIARTLKEEYGRRVHRSAYPSAATAIGLAIAMDERSGYELTERFSHHFGVFREANAGAEVAFDPILSEVTEQPSQSGEVNVCVRTYRAAHNVGHFRYIECGWLDDSGAPSGDITPFAEVLFPFASELRTPGVDLHAVRVERTGTDGPMVEERYAVHAGGIVELTITDLETGYARSHRLGAA